MCPPLGLLEKGSLVPIEPDSQNYSDSSLWDKCINVTSEAGQGSDLVRDSQVREEKVVEEKTKKKLGKKTGEAEARKQKVLQMVRARSGLIPVEMMTEWDIGRTMPVGR